MVALRYLVGFIVSLLLMASALEAVQISLPEVTAAAGERVRIPVQISGLADGDEILSSNLDVRFDTGIIPIDNVTVDRKGGLAANWIVAANVRLVPEGTDREGQVLIGAATGRDKITSEGPFFYLIVEVAPDASVGATTALRIQTVLLNNGEPVATTVDGSLLVVGQRVKADFIAIPQEGIAPLEVRFQDQSSGEIDAYAWNFGDGNTSAEQNPIHVYGQPGTYTVSLTVSNATGDDTETKVDYIEVLPDQRPPEIIEGPVVLGIGHNVGTVYWKTNEESNSQVQYCALRPRPIIASEGEVIDLFVEELEELDYFDDDEDDHGQAVRRWLLRGEMPHFNDNANESARFPLIAQCRTVESDALVTEHRVPLNGLSPRTFYIYRVRSADENDNYSSWKGGFFITLARPDDDAPVIILGPKATPAKHRALVQWVTDEPSNSFVQYGTDPDFQDDNRITVDELVSRHAVWLENLESDTKYFYRVRSSDAAGNASALRRGTFRTLRTDDEPPVITSSPVVTLRTPYKALIEWRTSTPSTSRVNYGTSEDYGRFVASDELVQHHKVLLTPLEPQTLYHFQAVSVDASGNEVRSEDNTFVTRGNPDVHPPGIVKKPYVIFRGTDRVTVGWEMDEPSNGYIEYGRNSDYDQRVEIAEYEREHRVTLTGLTPNTTYRARVYMVDLEGNGPTRSGKFKFKTASRRDEDEPEIESEPSVVSRSSNAVTISWRTDEASDSRIDFGLTEDYDRRAGDVELVRHHVVKVTGLEPGTTYYGQASSTDAFGNGPAYSDPFTFSTRPSADVTAPVIYAGPAVVARTHDSAVIEWRTDELADSMVEYGQDNTYGLELFSDRLSFVHRAMLTNLEPNTTYHFQVSSSDANGNGPTRSRDLSFTTEEDDRTEAPVIRQLSVRKVTRDRALIQWHTSKPADSAVEYGTDESYGERVESPDFERQRRMRLSGLEPNTTYHFRVISRSLDGGIAETRDYTFRTDDEPDNTPPWIVHRPEVVSSHSTATLRWGTNEPCYVTVRVGTEETWGTNAERIFAVDEAMEDHNVTITGLASGVRYFFTLISRDLSGNENVLGGRNAGKVVAPQELGGDISFVTDTEADFTPPAIVSGPHITALSNTEALVEWNTDEVGDSRLFIESDGQLKEAVFIPQHEFEHQVLLSDLDPGTTYHIRVGSSDPVGNGPEKSALLSFTTSAFADLVPPQIIQSPEPVALSRQTATIAWETDEATTADVFYGVDDLNMRVTGRDLSVRHHIELTNLLPGTRYQYQIRSADLSENGPTLSPVQTFTTPTGVDLVAPRLLAVPEVVSLSDRSATIVWTTDEAADGFVSFGSGEALDQTIGRVATETTHRVVLANLAPATTYRYQVASVDAEGNGPSTSAEATFTTLAEPDLLPPSSPTGLQAEALGAGKVQLDWQAVADGDVLGYNVYRAASGGTPSQIAGPLSGTSYVDQGLSEEAVYAYEITAVDRAHNEGAPSGQIALPVDVRGRGDWDGDGLVGLGDFFMLAERFGRQLGDSEFSTDFDMNGDGQIDFADFFSFVDLFGTRYGAARRVAFTAPSPADLSLSLVRAEAGLFEVDLVSRDLGDWQGVAVQLHYPVESVRFESAVGFGEGDVMVLEDDNGALSVAHYYGETVSTDGPWARLVFSAVPGARAGLLGVDQVAVYADGVTLQGLSVMGVSQVSLRPQTYALDPNFPNPFNPQTNMRFQLPQQSVVTLRIYDVLGQEVRTLVEGTHAAGVHRVTWDGRDSRGRPVASGVYFYALEARSAETIGSHFHQVRKLMLLR